MSYNSRIEKYLQDLKVVIPVGGEAKRLQPLTAEVSKAVVRFCNRPLIEMAIASLAKQGLKNFVFGVKGYVNYRSLHDYFQDGTGFSSAYKIIPRIHIKYQPAVDDLGSADSLRIITNYYEYKSFILVIQGDNLFELDIRDLIDFHLRKKAFMTICLALVKETEGYGIADIDNNFRIKNFVEKPSKEEAPSNLANAGIYLINPKIREIFDQNSLQQMIESRRRLDFGMDLIPYLVVSGYPVYGYKLHGDWNDVGTPEKYLKSMIKVLKSGGLSLKFNGKIRGRHNLWIEGESKESLVRRKKIMEKVADKKVTFEGAVLIGRHCQIGDRTKIKNSCIDNFSIIGEGVFIENSAIMDRAVICDYAQIQNSIIGRHVRIESSKQSSTCIQGMSVIGDDILLGEGCEILSTKIYPHKVIPSKRRMVNEILK